MSKSQIGASLSTLFKKPNIRWLLAKINKKELSETDICDHLHYLQQYHTKMQGGIRHDSRFDVRLLHTQALLLFGAICRPGTKKRKNLPIMFFSGNRVFLLLLFEAKDNNHTVSHGMQQALGYAEILEVPKCI